MILICPKRVREDHAVHIFRRQYVRNDVARFTCTGFEKISKQEGKTWIKGGLFKMKYQFVPRDPAAKKDFDADLSWCSLITDLGGKYYPG